MGIFDTGDLTDAADKMTAEINKVNLPSDVDFNVESIEAGGTTIAVGLVSDENRTNKELLQIASDIKADIEASSNEISHVDIAPDDSFKVNIVLDQQMLTQNQLSHSAVSSTIQSYISSLPSGSIKTEEGVDESININAPAQNIEDIENILIGGVRLNDIAQIERIPVNSENITFAGFLEDGKGVAKESVYMEIYKTDQGDSINISNAVLDTIDSLKKAGDIPDDVRAVTLFDSAPSVEKQITDLLGSASLGLVLILVVLLFFINFRAAVVVATILPLAFLATLFTLYVIGFTINILTLFAMILSLGILVDNAIVITEGIVFELEKGVSKREATLRALKNLGPAVTTATATTLVVFIPFASVGGIMGEFIKYIPYTIIIMLIISYFLAISITPLFGKWLLKEEEGGKKMESWHKYLVFPLVVKYGQKGIDDIANGYKKLIYRVHKHIIPKTVTLVLSIILIFGRLFSVGQLKGEQMPSVDSSLLLVTFEFPTGTTFETRKEVVSKAQEEIVDIPFFQTSLNFPTGEIYITIEEPTERRGEDLDGFDVAEQLDKDLQGIAQEYEGVRINAGLAGYGPPASEYDVTLEIKDNDLLDLERVSGEINEFAESRNDIERVINGYTDRLVSSVEVDFIDQALNDRGISNLQAAGAIRSVFSSEELGRVTVRDDGVSDRVYIEFSDEAKNSLEDLRMLPVAPRTVLSDIAEID